MKNICFDLCAIPFYCLILWTCHTKKLAKGRANRVFVAFNVVSLICAIADIWMEYVVNPLPISGGAVVLGTAISFTYKLLRNSCNLLYLVYVFLITKTDYLLHRPKWRAALGVPYAALVIVLLQNFFTHNVFVITAEGGYARGPVLSVLYAITFYYWIIGTGYCLYCRRLLALGKWTALLSVFVLTFVSVLIEWAKPDLMVEMLFTSIGMMMILLMVMRPEETIDASVNISSWKAYQDDLKNIIATGQHVQIIIIKLANAVEIRTYMGEDEFNSYISELGDELEKVCASKHIYADIYFERPASIYLMTRDLRADLRDLMIAFETAAEKRIQSYIEKGIRSDPKVCIIQCPGDLKEFRDIINMGHRFMKLGEHDRVLHRASELKLTRDYNVTSHIDEILNRVFTENTLEMYYQPIYDMKEKRFRSAEALARVRDTQYGMVSPAVFIPAAEATGLILPLGEKILDAVFRFISENDLASLGLSYIEINLSVAQCLQRDLPEIIRTLQNKYGVDPRQVNFEVTETLLGNLHAIMEKNVRELADMGYSFSLDDYGVGYSNIQRLRTLPLRIIKIDKSMVDDMFTEDGRTIIRNTVHMMREIRKELVVEGVETREAVEVCDSLSCDFIQGYYYSRPLPAAEFVAFVKENNADIPA